MLATDSSIGLSSAAPLLAVDCPVLVAVEPALSLLELLQPANTPIAKPIVAAIRKNRCFFICEIPLE
jgi:hypothetical protein